MTSREKAKEIFKKYAKGRDEHGWFLTEFDSCAKQCALIAVDEIINDNASIYSQQYWNEVKQEIEKL